MDCEPRSLGGTSTEWKLGQTTNFLIVRCGLGQPSNLGFTVKALHMPSNRIIELGNTGSIVQAWHREHGNLTYSMDLDQPYGTVPNYTTSDNFDDWIAKNSVWSGAEVLNSDLGSGTVAPASSGYDVLVKAYWPNHSEGCRPGRLACLLTDDSDRPHRGDANLWIKYPPAGMYDATTVTEWTNNLDNMNNSPVGRYFFLPEVLAHEFAHGLGVTHLPQRERHLMKPLYKSPSTITELSDSDEYGLLQTLETHRH